MNKYTIENLREGTTESFEVSITEEMYERFREISGDVNPLHNDTDYAKKKGYKDKVCYGLLTSSFYSTLAGVYLPGEHSLIHSIDIKFLKPVFAGDKLVITGKVSEIFAEMQMIVVKAKIENQNSKIVSKAAIKILIT